MKRFTVILSLLVLTATLTAAPGEREADRRAIRDHIDSIFRAYINKDVATIRSTHSDDWRGFRSGSRKILRGIDEYMQGITPPAPNAPPSGLKSYQMVDIDIIFHGDVAFVSYIADVQYHGPGNPQNRLTVADLYTRKDGHWIQSGSNTSLHPDSIAAFGSRPQTVPLQVRERILKVRESVWRAYFANDRAALEKLIPEETIAINMGGGPFATRRQILESSAQFAKDGGKLLRLEFPETEMQVYGNVVILYTTYLYELEVQGQRSRQEGRGTEIFVQRSGELVNSGWHLDSGR